MKRMNANSYATIQYSTVQYNTIQYNTIQYNTIQYNTTQYNTTISFLHDIVHHNGARKRWLVHSIISRNRAIYRNITVTLTGIWD